MKTDEIDSVLQRAFRDEAAALPEIDVSAAVIARLRRGARRRAVALTLAGAGAVALAVVLIGPAAAPAFAAISGDALGATAPLLALALLTPWLVGLVDELV